MTGVSGDGPTEKRVTQMEAGRALDVLIAEKVMGMALPDWTPTHGEVSSSHSSSLRSRWHLWPWEIRYWGTEKPIQWEPRRYSSDIAEAWRVLEKLKGGSFPMVSVNCGEPGWWVVLYPATGSFTETDYHETAPLAICLAALDALS